MVAKGLVGDDGAVRIGGTLVEKIRRWRHSGNRTMVDTGGFGDDWEYPQGVRKRATGSAEGVYATGAAGQAAITAAFDSGDPIVLDLQQKTGYVLSINAVISDLERGTDYDGASTFNFSFAQQGPPIAESGHAEA